MKTWQNHYRERMITAAEAAGLVKSGDRLAFSHACGEPRRLPQELVRRAKELKSVEIVHMVPMGEALYCRPEHAASFRHVALFVGKATRDAVWENRADFIPCMFREIPALFEKELPLDVAIVTISPPDKRGLCSLGVSVDYTKKAVECAKIVIAEVNRAMPRTHGNSFVPVREIDYFVEVDTPILELPQGRLTEEEKKIGRYVAELVEDECCLQMGIGGIPDAVLKNLGGFKDLGIHSEMISDGVKALVEQGAITGRKKTLHREKIVATFLMGSREFYDWVNDNPMIEMHTVDYTNDPQIIARNRKMVSINSALEIDLLGQICADMLGPRQFSAVGGQMDFVTGARAAEKGKAVIALPSKTPQGISRIVPTLQRGAAVTTPRTSVDYVVTDFGIAALRGKTVRARMKALIQIAHPRFREELEKQALEIYHLRL